MVSKLHHKESFGIRSLPWKNLDFLKHGGSFPKGFDQAPGLPRSKENHDLRTTYVH